MLMRRSIALLLLALTLMSCTNKEQPDKRAYLPFRFLVLAPGCYHDESFNQRCYEALQAISLKMKLQMDYAENVRLGAIKQIEYEAGKKYDFVIGFNSQTLPTLITIATENPEVKSTYIGHYPGNFENLCAMAYQPSHHYLAGVVAGLKSKTGRIGTIIDHDYPLTLEEVNAFFEGARRVNPNVYCNTIITRNDKDRRPAIAAATALKKNMVDVIFVNCGAAGNDVYKWAKANKVMTVGSVEDQYERAQGWVLTSVITNYEDIFAYAVEQMLKGQWQGGLHRFGMADKATELAPLRGVLNKEQKELFNEVYREVTELKGEVIEE